MATSESLSLFDHLEQQLRLLQQHRPLRLGEGLASLNVSPPGRDGLLQLEPPEHRRFGQHGKASPAVTTLA